MNGFFIFKVNAEEVSGDITENAHWTLVGNPYVVTNDIYIASGATLTIDAGVIVKFDYGTSMVVDGKLEALGTEESPIYFTSFYDDTVGGDTDGGYDDCYYNIDEDGNNVGEEICDHYNDEPQTGDWGTVFIRSVTSKSILNNVISRYSNDSLLLMNGGSVDSTNFTSDKDIYLYDSPDNSFMGLNVPSIEVSFGSSASITNATISNPDSYRDAVSIYRDSSADIKNSNISGYNGIEVFQNSSINFTDSSVECENDGIAVFVNSSLTLSGGDINCGYHGIYIFSDSMADITGVKISGASEAGVIAHSNPESDGIKITKSEITGNENGFLVWGGDVVANENSIHDNTTSAVTTYDSDQFTFYNYDFTNNFWGNPSGPIHATLLSGLAGDILDFDNILYTPFLTSDPLIEKVRNPVILIPGITGTYLNRNYGDNDEIWPDAKDLISSLDDKFLDDLILNDDGTEKAEFPIISGDIIRDLAGVHVFDNLITELTNAGYIEGTDLFVFPYDWRLSTKSTAELLKGKINEVLSETGQGKVDIVAHSMGGLVAKKYISDNGADKIDQLIFLGTPQLGAPKAFKALMYGDDMGYKKSIFSFLNSLRTKFISQNMPSVYELLPSLKYITQNGNYITDALHEIIIPNSSFSLDYLGTKNLMIKEGRNPLMFPFAEDLHDSIDDLDLSGIKTYNFVGCGSSTIGEITMSTKRSWKKLFLGLVDDYHMKYVDGDETVPLVSSTRTIGSDIYYAVGVSHGALPSSEGVKQGVLSILKDEGLTFGDVLKDDSSYCGIEGKVISTHSPVELHVYDEEGNHTGLKEDGNIEYGIEGVTFDMIEGENYAFLPNNRNFKIVTKATDTGGYNFLIEDQNKAEDIIATYKWTLIPLSTLQTTGEIWVGPDYSPADYEVKIDKDGDGKIDANYTEGFDGTELAEKATKKIEKTRNSAIVGFIPKKEKNENWGGSNFIDNIKIPKEEKITYYNDKPKEINNKLETKNGNEKIENKEIKKNNLVASAGSLDIKMKKSTLITIIGSSILVLLLAIKFIFKVK